MARETRPVVVAREVAALLGAGTAVGVSDGALLDRFRGGRADEAEAAFAALVGRHAPMVLGVCRRFLGDRHDAEDAAQATSLVLAQRAGSIRRAGSVASWLHGVAAKVAARARRGAARRLAREHLRAEGLASSGGLAEAASREADDRDALEALHQELARLPERFRLPILLCHLEGLSHEQAARRLDCPVRTVQSRLARGRGRLRDRLTRRGLAPATTLISLATLLGEKARSEAVPAAWKHATAQAAARVAATGPEAAGISADVAAVAEGVTRTMSVNSWMRRASSALRMALAAGGIGAALMARAKGPEPGPAPRGTRGAAPPAAASNADRFLARSADGAAVEVVAVSTLPTGPRTWWKPDGTRLEAPPVDVIEPKGARPVDVARVILVRATGLKEDAHLRWHPAPCNGCWGGTPTRDGRNEEGLQSCLATFTHGQEEAAVQARVAGGDWKTEVTNDGKGGARAVRERPQAPLRRGRPFAVQGRPGTAFAVAHDAFDRARRIVAIGPEGNPHPAERYSMGPDGDPKWVIDLIDAEIPLPPDQIREYQVRLRPFEQAELRGIAPHPRPDHGGAGR
ncbi:ECF RNA polymerase sigma factor SigE [Aquisphaera giovannonii]|uniref:ECF RNA polymerase sigma factor SigE n=1 Tax=Aquisphaera giovannonii TaxID=406548 RepID=A0A5B9WDV1_9BACT|nr:sigma-70 family RNA polymerase sigma factor [Aquisphaera giovannonii]QEH38762.1 ECF RNA polymerase sigma factor SigE [Aquisphaera giovannonii]